MDLRRPTLIPILAAALICLAGIGGRAQRPAQDQGAAGAWQKIRKLQTTASAMHTTAHPDDEQGGMLALWSRGQGARVSLLTLTRGESGDNAIGPELFDALGLIRTEELLVADRYYGVDNRFRRCGLWLLKRLDAREVGPVRPSRRRSHHPDGSPDGPHRDFRATLATATKPRAAGVLAQDASGMAGDPMAFPEQLTAGRARGSPWAGMAGVRGSGTEPRIIPGNDPVLGENIGPARLGLSFQRSQGGGHRRAAGPSVPAGVWRWRRARSPQEAVVLRGIDTDSRTLSRWPHASARGSACRADVAIKGDRGVLARRPSAAVPALARALAEVTNAIILENEHLDVKAAFIVKRRQISEAIHAALGISLTAIAQPEGASQTGALGGEAVPMPPVVPGQPFKVRATFVNPSSIEATRVIIFLDGKDVRVTGGSSAAMDAGRNQPIVRAFTTSLGESHLTWPHFSRASIRTHDTRADAAAMPPPPERLR
jgi:hypothetical protein